MAFQCIVLTPEQQLLNEKIQQAIIPAHDGLLGVLTDRAPIMVRLGVGPLRVDIGPHQSRYFFVESGLAQMKDNTLTILTSKAVPASEIDGQAASEEYAQALALKAANLQEQEQKELALQRARAKQSVVGK